MEIYNPCGLNLKKKTLMNDKKTLTLASNERIAAAPQIQLGNSQLLSNSMDFSNSYCSVKLSETHHNVQYVA